LAMVQHGLRDATTFYVVNRKCGPCMHKGLPEFAVSRRRSESILYWLSCSNILFGCCANVSLQCFAYYKYDVNGGRHWLSVTWYCQHVYISPLLRTSLPPVA
jgi:hypothetical protein